MLLLLNLKICNVKPEKAVEFIMNNCFLISHVIFLDISYIITDFKLCLK